jgi:porin
VLTGLQAAIIGLIWTTAGLASVRAAHAAQAPEPPAPPAPEESPVEGPATDAQPEEVLPAEPQEQSPTDPLPPTGVEEELSLIRPGLLLKREFDELAAKTNLRLAVAHTLLFQQATGGMGDRDAGGGDLDLLAKWTAIGAGTKDTGILAFAAEYRYQIGDQAPSALGGQLGTLTGTTNGFGERPMIVKEFYWDQRLFEDRFRYAIGRIDPENLFGGHRLQSANLYFLNKAFSSNPTIAFPGPGLAAAAQIKPVPWLYIDGGITDANGSATASNFDGFFEEHEYLGFVEAALTPTIGGVGSGRYRVALWHIDSRKDAGKPSDRGVTISLDQDIGKVFTVFLRYGHADGDVTGVANSVQGGVGIKGVAGDEGLLGLAAAWSEPTGDRRDEKVFEVFQRFQINETIQFMIGAQLILDPSNAPEDDALGVFSARLRVSF